MEPASDKEKKEMKQVAHLASEIAKHRSDPEEIAQAIVQYITNDRRNKIYKKKEEESE